MTTYIALIHKDADSDYGVSFPDLPGCVTAGSTIDEALAMAKEALALQIEGLLEEGEAVPTPSPPEAIERDDAVALAAIEIPDNMRVERVNITVPALTLQRFDAFAVRQGMTRSGLFVEAVHRWIQVTASARVSRAPRDGDPAIQRELLDRFEEIVKAELGRQKAYEGMREASNEQDALQSDEAVINLLDALRARLKKRIASSG
jgi:predicted RNase H-like HicB family nuclease